MRDELVVFVWRKGRPHRLHEQPIELVARDVLDHHIVDLGDVFLQELVVLRRLEVLIGEPRVVLQFLFVRQIVAIAHFEVPLHRHLYLHRPVRDRAEQRPLDQRLDRPREVVVEARQRDVGARVRVVDREDLAVLDQGLAGVELPQEERVDETADRHDLPAGFRREEAVLHLIAPVYRLRRVVAHHHRLGADREAASEDVESFYRRLEVHEPLAGFVVAPVELVGVLDPRHADPCAPVERLHEQRVADLLRDAIELERPVVLRGGVGEARVVGRLLVGDQPGFRDLQAEPDHGRVGGVLLHRLERERVVHEVHVVHQSDLLQPLPRDVVPVREAVDHE